MSSISAYVASTDATLERMVPHPTHEQTGGFVLECAFEGSAIKAVVWWL